MISNLRRKSGIIQPATVEEQQETSNLVIFHEKEIEIGALLGKGTFANVNEVTKIQLLSSPKSKNKIKNKVYCQSSSSLQREALCKEATRTNTGGTCFAVKQLKNSVLQSQGDQLLLATIDIDKEIRVLSSIDHENIVKVRGVVIGSVGSDCKKPRRSVVDKMLLRKKQPIVHCIIMEKLQGTLDQRIKQWKRNVRPSNKIDVEAGIIYKANLAYQIAKGIDYLHEHRIIYRDLKPKNIGFKDDSTINIFDFGLCRELPVVPKASSYAASSSNHKTATTNECCFQMSMAGTFRYMAPEILNSPHCYNTKADVYSWSLVFYYMLSLTKPYSNYTSQNDHKIYVCKHGVRPEINTRKGLSVPKDIETILKHSWDQNIWDRYTMKSVCDHLEKYLNDKHIRQIPTGYFCDEHQPEQQREQNGADEDDDSVSSIW